MSASAPRFWRSLLFKISSFFIVLSQFVAFATSSYSQEKVLFLCAVFDFPSSSDKKEAASLIMREYLDEKAPHDVRVSAATRKAIEKKLKQGKLDDNLFEEAWKEVEKDLAVYQQYEDKWLKV